jgi:ubiquinone biosynthesis protein COQ4
MKAKMLETESGRRILHERPRLRSPFLNKEKIASYPPGTLGGEYHKFMSTYGYEFDHRPLVRHMPDAEFAYIFQRYKEIHDFYHVCLRQGVTMYDEMVVKYFEFKQTTLPSAGSPVLFGALATGLAINWTMAAKLAFEDGPKMLRAAAKAKDFMSVMFEDHLDENFVRVIQDQFRMWIFNAEDEDDEILDP